MVKGTLSRTATMLVVAGLICAVALGALVLSTVGRNSNRVSAQFASAVGVYPGTDVKVRGIKVGTVTKVQPQGDTVRVEMKYDGKRKIPSDAVAVLVASSLVSQRYVQLEPIYTSGPALPDNASIPKERTATPAELDDIYAALNKVSTALGPEGANKTGALNDLLKTTAANLGGNGQALGSSLSNLSHAIETLANGRDDLFGTVKNLNSFTKALADNDAQVRKVNDLLAEVAADLANERDSLATTLKMLSGTLHDVAVFLQTNKDALIKDVRQLKDVTGVLVKQKGALDEIGTLAGPALGNLVHVANFSSGTLDTRGNFSSLTSPLGLCAVLNQYLGKLLDGVLLTTCQSVAKGNGGTLPQIPGLPTLDLPIPVGGLLNNLGSPLNLPVPGAQ